MDPTTVSENGSSNSSYPTEIGLAFSPYITVLYIGIYLPLAFCIIFGNLLVIFAFVYHRELRRVQNYLLISLAVTDTLTGVLAITPYLIGRLVISPMTCWSSTRFYFFQPALILCASSVYHLLFIAIDRCLSLIFPLKYPRLLTSRRVMILITVIWMFNIGFACLPFVIPSSETDQWVCTAGVLYESEVDNLFLSTASFIPAFFVCMVTLYAVMLRVASKHIKRRRELTNQVDALKEAQARRRGIMTMAIVVGAFGICWIPTSLKFAYETYASTTKNKLITVQAFAEYIGFVNSMVNPLIYGYFNRQFKIGFRIVLRKWWCAEERHMAADQSTSRSNILLMSETAGRKRGNE